MARRYSAMIIGLCLAIWLAEGSLTGPAAPKSARAAQSWTTASPSFAETEASALADLSATLLLGAMGFSGLALFNRRLRLAGIERDVSVNKTGRR